MLNIVLFLFNVTMISLRFYFYPKTFRASLTHPTESLFPAAIVISFGIILTNISEYGISTNRTWLAHVMVVMFWIECGISVAFTIGIFLTMYVFPRNP